MGTKPKPVQVTKARSWRDVLQVHPECEVFPLVGKDELRDLSESIKKNGLQQPIVLIRQAREDGGPPVSVLIDGRNRLDAMEMAGIPIVNAAGNIDPSLVPSWVLDEGEIDPSEYVIAANIRRRHLTGEQRDAALRALIKANPEKSNRRLAKAAGSSPTHVGKLRDGLEKAGMVSTESHHIDAKGVKQPARKSKTKGYKPRSAEERAIARKVEVDVARAVAATRQAEPIEPSAKTLVEPEPAPAPQAANTEQAETTEPVASPVAPPIVPKPQAPESMPPATDAPPADLTPASAPPEPPEPATPINAITAALRCLTEAMLRGKREDRAEVGRLLALANEVGRQINKFPHRVAMHVATATVFAGADDLRTQCALACLNTARNLLFSEDARAATASNIDAWRSIAAWMTDSRTCKSGALPKSAPGRACGA